jgi:hypothetical protein
MRASDQVGLHRRMKSMRLQGSTQEQQTLGGVRPPGRFLTLGRRTEKATLAAHMTTRKSRKSHRSLILCWPSRSPRYSCTRPALCSRPRGVRSTTPAT